MPYANQSSAPIYYETHGNGEPILLIPGLGSGLNSWALVAAELAKQFEVIIMEPRGSGRSEPSDLEYTGDLVASDVLAVLDDANRQSVHLVGVSMGGMIAQQFVLRHPERVRSLTLVATYAHGDDWTERVFDVRRMVIDSCGIKNHFRMSTLFLTSPETFRDQKALIEIYESGVQQHPPNQTAYLRQIDFCTSHDTRQQLSEIHTPSLVVAGSRDLLIPPYLSQQLSDGLNNSRYVELSGSHVLTSECYEAFVSQLTHFLVEVKCA